ncbi:MAG: response regulator [Gemmatimonas sp.]
MDSLVRNRHSVLLVDDDPAFVYTHERVLQRAGYRVATATSFLDALEMVSVPSDPFDVLIADVVLDEGSGFALTRMTRSLLEHTRPLYVTGYDVPLDDAMGPVLRKPLTPETLVAAVDDLLRNVPRRPESPLATS